MDKPKIVYDIAGTPRGMSLAEVVQIVKDHGWVIWDSDITTSTNMQPKEPKVLEGDDVVVDMSKADPEQLAKIKEALDNKTVTKESADA